MEPTGPTLTSALRPKDLLRLVNHTSLTTLEQIQQSCGVGMDALWRDLEILRKYPSVLHDFVRDLKDAQMTRITSNFADKLAVLREEAARRGGDIARILAGGGAGLEASGPAAAAGISIGTIVAASVIGAVVVGGILYFTVGPGAADRPIAPGPQFAREHEPSRKDVPVVPRAGTAYCAWFADNIALKPVFVGSQADFEARILTNQVQGGGDPAKPAPVMKKTLIVPCGAEPTLADTTRAACAQFGPAFVPGQTYVHTEWLAVRKATGERHDIDNLGGCRIR